ncbi:Protein of unknown function [Cotesia congregata]|uniref:Uncharacterized protein n=1 Tax=Cotesia congregata TaxID=51543 RepID=A0A8J2HQ89_COTCN|nr:Protein of unknown function [Cotesia congregata]
MKKLSLILHKTD